MKEQTWQTLERLITYQDEDDIESVPILQDQTLGEEGYKFWISVALSALEKVLEDEDKKEPDGSDLIGIWSAQHRRQLHREPFL